MAALLLSNVSEEISRQSIIELTGSDTEFDGLKRFYGLARCFRRTGLGHHAEAARGQRKISGVALIESDAGREAWRSLVEEPLGRAIERYLQDDLVRGLVLTDAKIGVFTHPHDESLLQNRCFLYHLIGNKTGEWKVPVGGMGNVARTLEEAARKHGAELLTRVDLRHLDLSRKRSHGRIRESTVRRRRSKRAFSWSTLARTCWPRCWASLTNRMLPTKGRFLRSTCYCIACQS